MGLLGPSVERDGATESHEIAAKKRPKALAVSPPDVVGPASPERARAARLSVPGAQRSGAAPERQDEAGDAPSAPAIRLVMHAVEGRRGPVFLADGVCTGGSASRAASAARSAGQTSRGPADRDGWCREARASALMVRAQGECSVIPTALEFDLRPAARLAACNRNRTLQFSCLGAARATDVPASARGLRRRDQPSLLSSTGEETVL
jgi:hypothetical protein